ncbi:MAG TPA: oxygenase MpaB family protein [Draconibacterium sp.]|nr:oxygenase MpaB family protein [Draconibacterium sp.]
MNVSTSQFIWNGIDLEALRQVMDQPADDAVSEIFKSKSMDHLRSVLKGMAQNDSFVTKEFPDVLHDFVENELKIRFTSEDIEMFNQAHEIWKEHGMNFVFILFFRALPYTYMAEKPANVLTTTKLLVTHTERRVFETAQFVFDVMDKNWWEPDKRGILTALKVRIMHAAMRHIILARTAEEKWNEAWGKPISQEDLIATNQVFSLEFFKGMEYLGETLNADQQKAWFHTWKTIGKIMGVEDRLISKDVNEAWTLQHTVYAHLFKDKTIAGIPLTRALVDTLQHFHLPQRLILLIMRRMLADEQFPDCFERMLKPTFKDQYPEIFEKHESEEGKEKHKALLDDHFHTHLREYYHKMKEIRPNYQTTKPKASLLERILFFLLQLFGKGKKQIHLIDIQLERLHKNLHIEGTNNPVDELEEDVILDSMAALGGIMVGILSFHFRKGKDSGFRIPDNLKDNWALKG